MALVPVRYEFGVGDNVEIKTGDRVTFGLLSERWEVVEVQPHGWLSVKSDGGVYNVKDANYVSRIIRVVMEEREVSDADLSRITKLLG